MAKSKNSPKKADASAATVGFETQLWQMADTLPGSMNAAEDPDECRSQNLFRAPLAASWAHLNELGRWERL